MGVSKTGGPGNDDEFKSPIEKKKPTELDQNVTEVFKKKPMRRESSILDRVKSRLLKAPTYPEGSLTSSKSFQWLFPSRITPTDSEDSDYSNPGLKDSIVGLRNKITSSSSDDKVALWEDRIENILELKGQGATLRELSTIEKQPLLERLYAEGRSEVFGLKPGSEVMGILMSEDPKVDGTRVMHLLEPQIEGIRDLVQIAHGVEKAHQSTSNFVMDMKRKGVLDKILQLEAMSDYQAEQIEKAFIELRNQESRMADPEQIEDTKSGIEIFEHRRSTISQQLDELYGEIEKNYLPFYQDVISLFDSFSPEEVRLFLEYIGNKNSKKAENIEAMKELEGVLKWCLSDRKKEAPPAMSVDFLRVSNNLVKGFLQKLIEGALSL